MVWDEQPSSTNQSAFLFDCVPIFVVMMCMGLSGWSCLQAHALGDEDRERVSSALMEALQEKAKPCPPELLEKYRYVSDTIKSTIVCSSMTVGIDLGNAFIISLCALSGSRMLLLCLASLLALLEVGPTLQQVREKQCKCRH